ncbi:MAG: hypothetical protein Kow0069_14920 [Promethearchaeota archaeon]
MAKQVIDAALEAENEELAEEMSLFVLEASSRKKKFEKEVVAGWLSELEGAVARGDIARAEEVGVRAFDYAVEEGDERLKEEVRKALVRVQTRGPPAGDARPDAKAGTRTEAKLERQWVEFLVDEAGVRATRRRGEEEFRADSAHASLGAAQTRVSDLERSGLVRRRDFFVVRVVRSALAGRACFDESGEAWVVYKRDV